LLQHQRQQLKNKRELLLSPLLKREQDKKQKLMRLRQLKL